MANSADPDQLASSEANWSGSTLFAKKDLSGFSRTRVKQNHKRVSYENWFSGDNSGLSDIKKKKNQTRI